MHSLCLQFVHSTVSAILSESYKSANLDQETFMEEQAYNNPSKVSPPQDSKPGAAPSQP
jgi:hypothetical protein